MVLESDSGEDLDNDTYNSDDFSDESDDEKVADGFEYPINTHWMSNDDGSSGSHRVSVPQGQAQHSLCRKCYTNTQIMQSDSSNETSNEVSEVSIAPTPYPTCV